MAQEQVSIIRDRKENWGHEEYNSLTSANRCIQSGGTSLSKLASRRSRYACQPERNARTSQTEKLQRIVANGEDALLS